MKVISSVELRNNLKKYLDSARTETVVIQRGKNETFVLTRQEDLPEDLSRAVSMDEAIGRVETGMREIIEKRKRSTAVQ
jgi:hypothetical protein